MHLIQQLFSRIIDFVELAAVCALDLKRRRNIEYIRLLARLNRTANNGLTLINSITIRCRMSVKSFDDLSNLIRPFNTYQDTMWRKAIPPVERLSVTLR